MTIGSLKDPNSINMSSKHRSGTLLTGASNTNLKIPTTFSTANSESNTTYHSRHHHLSVSQPSDNQAQYPGTEDDKRNSIVSIGSVNKKITVKRQPSNVPSIGRMNTIEEPQSQTTPQAKRFKKFAGGIKAARKIALSTSNKAQENNKKLMLTPKIRMDGITNPQVQNIQNLQNNFLNKTTSSATIKTPSSGDQTAAGNRTGLFNSQFTSIESQENKNSVFGQFLASGAQNKRLLFSKSRSTAQTLPNPNQRGDSEEKTDKGSGCEPSHTTQDNNNLGPNYKSPLHSFKFGSTFDSGDMSSRLEDTQVKINKTTNKNLSSHSSIGPLPRKQEIRKQKSMIHAINKTESQDSREQDKFLIDPIESTVNSQVKMQDICNATASHRGSRLTLKSVTHGNKRVTEAQAQDTTTNPSMATYGWRLVKHTIGGGKMSVSDIVTALTKPEDEKADEQLRNDMLEEEDRRKSIMTNHEKDLLSRNSIILPGKASILPQTLSRKSLAAMRSGENLILKDPSSKLELVPNRFSVASYGSQISQNQATLHPGGPSAHTIRNSLDIPTGPNEGIKRFQTFKRNISVSNGGKIPHLRVSNKMITLNRNRLSGSVPLTKDSLKKPNLDPTDLSGGVIERPPCHALTTIDEKKIISPSDPESKGIPSSQLSQRSQKIPLAQMNSGMTDRTVYSKYSDQSVFESPTEEKPKMLPGSFGDYPSSTTGQSPLPVLSALDIGIDSNRPKSLAPDFIHKRLRSSEADEADGQKKPLQVQTSEEPLEVPNDGHLSQDTKGLTDEKQVSQEESLDIQEMVMQDFMPVLQGFPDFQSWMPEDIDLSLLTEEELYIQEMAYHEQLLHYIENLDRENPDFLTYMAEKRLIQGEDGVPYIYNYDLGLYLPYLQVDENWSEEDKFNYRIMMDDNGDQVAYDLDNKDYIRIEMTTNILREYLEQIREDMRILYDLAGTPYFYDWVQGHCVPATLQDEELFDFYEGAALDGQTGNVELYLAKDRIPRQPGGMLAAGWVTPKEDINPDVVDQFNEMPDYRPFFTSWITTVQIIILCITLFKFDLAHFGFNMIQKNSTLSSYQQTGPKTKIFSAVEKDLEPNMNFWIGPTKQDLIKIGVKYAPCMRPDNKLKKCFNNYKKIATDSGCCMQRYTVGGDGKPFCTHLAREKCGYHYNKNNCISSNKNERTKEQNEDLKNDNQAECTIVARPCCISSEGRCEITTEEWCNFHGGYYNPDKIKCDEVNCLERTCQLLPFISNSNGTPDQWYRLFLSLFIHYGILDLVISIVVQMTLVRDIEILCGWKRTAMIFLGSGIIGNIASVIFSPYTPDAGPTPAHFGILACSYVEMVQLWPMFESPWKALMKYVGILIALLLLGLLPWMDNFSNLAGFFAGIFMAFFLMPYVVFNDADKKKKQIKKYFAMVIFVIYTLFLIGAMYGFQSHENYPWLKKINCITNNPYIEKLISSIFNTRIDVADSINNPANSRAGKETSPSSSSFWSTSSSTSYKNYNTPDWLSTMLGYNLYNYNESEHLASVSSYSLNSFCDQSMPFTFDYSQENGECLV